MKRRLALFLVVLVVGAAFAHASAEERSVVVGGGAGGIWHRDVGLDDASSLGVIGTAFVEFLVTRNLGVRAEASWIALPALVTDARGVPTSLKALDSNENPARFAGGALSLTWFSEEQSWGQSYLLFGAGIYRATQLEETLTVLVVGPGVGWTFLHGSPTIGLELNAQLAVFDVGRIVMVPIRLLVRF